MHAKAHPKTVGSQASVQFLTFTADNERHMKVSWNVYGVLDTTENRIRLPSALGDMCSTGARSILD